MKFALLLPVVVFAVRVLADVPPACLLQAVNTQDNPSDLAAVCGNEALDVQKAIASLCDNSQAVAQSAFISTCSGAGSSVGKSGNAHLRHRHALGKVGSDKLTTLGSSLHRNLERCRPNVEWCWAYYDEWRILCDEYSGRQLGHWQCGGRRQTSRKLCRRGNCDCWCGCCLVKQYHN